MTYVVSSDGITLDRTLPNLPAEHWEQLTPDTGTFHSLDVGNAASFGYYLMVENVQPSPDHLESIVNGPVGTFTQTWTFDQASQDDRLDTEARDIEGGRSGKQVAWLRSQRGVWAAHAPVNNNPGAQDFANELLADLPRLFRTVADILSGELRNDDPADQDPI